MFYFANICPSFCHLKSTNLRLTASSKMCEEVGSSNIHQQFEIMSFCIKEYGNETDLVETRKKNSNHHNKNHQDENKLNHDSKHFGIM